MAGGDRASKALAAAIEQAARGETAIVHLVGSRGAGRTWHLDEAAAACHIAGIRAVRVNGSSASATRPFGALRPLLRDTESPASEPGTLARQAIDDVLQQVVQHGPVVILVDDTDRLDPDSIDALGAVVRGLDVDAVAVISTSITASPWHDVGGETVPLDPLSDDDLADLLRANGLAETPAQRCAQAAAGNPGLAMALADGLTIEQRRGDAPLAMVPRAAGALADDLRQRLTAHGEPIGRALVVAASEPGGDVQAVRAALVELGERPTTLDAAEEAGLVEIIGARVIFTDPWTAMVAPSLVAPASRRAAHRALAAAFTRPDQAAARAWQLAAAANGPSDDIAVALGLVANDAAQRGALRTAIATAERAAEFAESEEVRVERLLPALGWALDADDAPAVRRTAAAVDDTTIDVADALTEANAYLHGEPAISRSVRAGTGPERTGSGWGERTTWRRAVTAALDAGDHATALGLIGQPVAFVPGTNATALAYRHRGDVREARNALLATEAGAAMVDPDFVLAADAPFGAWTALLVAADLNILAGRGDDATRALALNAARVPATLSDWAAVLTARAMLQTDPTADPSTHRDAFQPFGTGALADVRHLVATGVTQRDLAALDEAIALTERERLPVEGAEARLWAIPLRDPAVQQRERSAAAGALQRCGVRGWDRRIEQLASTTGAPGAGPADSPARAVDPEVAALSAAERRVADAVASGMTNRETAASLIVSVKTVDFHLQQIYRKLGIRSRTELAIRMMGHGNE